MARFSVNGQSHNIDVDPSTPLLWVLREQVGLTGTKYGCGIAQCGACTVHVDGAATRSCSIQAFCTLCSVPFCASPSMVVICLPSTVLTGTEHDRVAAPST